MKHLKVTLMQLLTVWLITFGVYAQNKDATVNLLNKRIEDLLKKMTLEEKTMQLQNRSFDMVARFMDKDGNINQDSLKKILPNGLGGLNISINLEPEIYVKVVNQLQKFSTTTKNGIPMMFVGEGLHGYMSRGATVFPQAIALGCSWDTLMAERLFAATALEARARGVRQLLSPVLDLGREPRFGRIEEMYSEDPYLVAALGIAAVNGFQGRTDMPDNGHVAATLKHFVGHGQPEGGRNVAPINISYYDLLNDHIFPFEQVIKKARPLSVMPSYNEINGVPNHGNTWLLKDILRESLQFKGQITSDQNAIDEMYRLHAFVESADDAAKLAISNTIDLDIEFLSGTYGTLDKLVKSGKLSETVINDAVRRVLKMKFIMGLFDNPYADVQKMKAVTNNEAHKKLALEAAHKSMVLLKNDNALLPLDSAKIKSVAVIGPLAKGVHFGGYTAEPRIGIDLIEGITTFAKGRFKVVYAEGCKIAREEASFWKNGVHTPNGETDDRKLIKEAVETALQSDVVIMALGETESFSREAWGEDHRGDRSDITLLGLQNELVSEVLKTGKPTIVVMFGGRPLAFNFVAKNVTSVIQAFYLGQATGTALADVIFGKFIPSGKLSVTIPKSVGELPCYYSRKPTRSRSYVNEENEPLFPFGFGLSYTTFEYSAPQIDKKVMKANESVTITVAIKNTGKYQGEEVVQLYIRDMVSSGVRPVMELKDFAKISLLPGESKVVKFVITPEKLMFYNYNLKKILEPGEFKVMTGPNSQNVQALKFTLK